ncbi:MAG: hypothetical protein LBE74_08260 [Treponema sp.]|jgi:hypothetical protein|nr:hypothetical protein [Treponema sp.]
MKKNLPILFFIFIIFFPADKARAQNKAVQLGFGLEGNMNTAHGGAFGRSMSVDIQLFKYIVNGVILTVSDDFAKFTAIEPEIFARYYLPLNRISSLKEKALFNIKDGGFFVQGDLGVSIDMGLAVNVTPRLLGGLTAGLRYSFKDGDYYIEPFLKTGYPFLFGGGLRFGCKF